ncbi:HEAT repeat domain-containing protein [Nocardia sp. NPDC050630]|uniref:HEAT repeat domain-containing protein n=1 Tax=Nocardia sp. NPDC050630 TaxID=3364321 RepID=UPI0037A99AA2
MGAKSGGTEWMNELPVRYRDGERGFDRRIMQDLAAVGVPCYALGDLSNGAGRSRRTSRYSSTGWPISRLGSWGRKTEHRSSIRSGLIRNLIDPAARGNEEAIDLLIAQVRHRPPIPERMQTWACDALRLIAGSKNFVQIAKLLEELPEGTAIIPLVEYLGKVKTPESRDIALKYLDGPARGKAINALVQMKATGVRHLIEPLVHDRAPAVRKQAQRALEKLSS